MSAAARLTVLVVMCGVGLLGVALLAASFVPGEPLAGRALGAVGETRTGSFAQDLVANVGGRLRFAAGLLLALDVGLVLVRSALVDLVAARSRRVTMPSARTLALVGVPTVLAIALRIPFLSQPMRYDEALTFNEFASRPLYYALSFYPDPNNHLLNTLLMHLAFVGLGNEPWVLRLPAFLAGVLLVPASYVLARLLFGEAAAVLAAALVAVSSYLVEYSTDGRGYMLQALCFVVLLGLVEVVVRRGSRGALLPAAVVGALGAYAVPTMLYGVGVVAVRLIGRGLRPQHLLAAGLFLSMLVAILYLPVIVVSGPDKLVSNRFVVAMGFSELISELPTSLARTWALWNRDVPWPFAALLVAGFAIGCWRQPLGLVAVGVCLGFVLVQRVAPFERVWLFLLPLYFVIASGGLARFVDGRVLGVAFGAVLAFFTLTSGSILTSTETGTFPDAESVARVLAPRLAPDDAVLTTLPTSLPELQYYFPRFGLPINVLVRSPDEAQNLWVIAPNVGAEPEMAGWRTPTEIERFSGSRLLKYGRAAGAR